MMVRKIFLLLFTVLLVLVTVSVEYTNTNSWWQYLNYRFLIVMLLYISSIFLCITNFLYAFGMLLESWEWTRKGINSEFFICLGYIVLLLLLIWSSPLITLLFCLLIGLQEGKRWVKKQKTTTWL
ncbi:membrane protein implicated in regulation of membrane protease activity [Croceifilum oryzae]|uniref:Membrane protein implicated in regulation of membrane protease activity n=1 Tax=Croceifilum oryzae TaxID=1553429 RepID=A0AAJ1WTI4_9BACL|nr:membrane protein implicated in regulation of membrane protease activity [Croceifilum oryzae]